MPHETRPSAGVAATMNERPSPNFDERRCAVTMLIFHYTGMAGAGEALDRLTDPASGVSAHYLVDEDGTVTMLVPEALRAWHAGVASWRGIHDVNSASVGIEIVNPGHEFGYRPYPARQMEAVAGLGRNILARHAMPQRNVLGHSDVAPERKQDPGELFDWCWLAARGVGVWPHVTHPATGTWRQGDGGEGVAGLQRCLARFGYGITVDGRYGTTTTSVVTAFQRHFRPAGVDGVADGETRARLARLLELAH